MAAKEGEITTLKEARKWLNEQERVDAPQVAAKRWRAIKLHHDGWEIHLRDWWDFRGQYVLLCRNVEDWNEGDEQSHLLNLLPDAWVKRVTKEEAKRAKNNHTVKMMLNGEHHKNVVNWTRAKVVRDFKRQSLQNALLITVSGHREKAVIWRLDKNEVGSQTIRLQAIPARMSCNDVLEWIREEVLKEYKNLAHNRGLQTGDRSIYPLGAGSDGEAVMDPSEAESCKGLDVDGDEHEPAQTAVCAFVVKNLHKGSNRGSCKPLQQGWKQRQKKERRRVGDPPLSFGEFIRADPQGCFVCYGRSSPFQHNYRTCPIHKADTEAYKREKEPKSVRQPTFGKPRWRCPRTSSPSS